MKRKMKTVGQSLDSFLSFFANPNIKHNTIGTCPVFLTTPFLLFRTVKS